MTNDVAINESNTKPVKQMRLSGIELLKIIAFFIIVLSHALPLYGEANFLTNKWDFFVANSIISDLTAFDFNTLLIAIVRNAGSASNGVFIACSAFFLVDKDKIAINKVFHIVIDSLLILGVFIATYIGVYGSLSFNNIAGYILTTLSGSNNWFIGAYLIMYLAHPLLNKIINNSSKKTLFITILLSLLLFSILPIITVNKFVIDSSRIIMFFIMYLTIGFFKRYPPKAFESKKKLTLILIISICSWIALLVVRQLLIANVELFKINFSTTTFLNPFAMAASISAVFLFKGFRFKSRFINYIGSLSLLVYLLTENILGKQFFRPLVFNYIYTTFGYDQIFFWSILYGIVLFTSGILLASAYHFSIGKLVSFVSLKLEIFIKFIYRKTIKRFVENE